MPTNHQTAEQVVTKTKSQVGHSMGFQVKCSTEFPWKTFSMAIPHGQIAYENSMETRRVP